MEQVFKEEIEFEVIDCATCGVPFALTETFLERRADDGKSFYCPNGHANCFPGEDDAESDGSRILDDVLAKAKKKRFWFF